MMEFFLWLIVLLCTTVISAELDTFGGLALWALFGVATWVWVKVREREWELEEKDEFDERT